MNLFYAPFRAALAGFSLVEVFVNGEPLPESPFVVGVLPVLCPYQGQQASVDGKCYCAAPCAPSHAL